MLEEQSNGCGYEKLAINLEWAEASNSAVQERQNKTHARAEAQLLFIVVIVTVLFSISERLFGAT